MTHRVPLRIIVDSNKSTQLGTTMLVGSLCRLKTCNLLRFVIKMGLARRYDALRDFTVCSCAFFSASFNDIYFADADAELKLDVIIFFNNWGFPFFCFFFFCCVGSCIYIYVPKQIPKQNYWWTYFEKKGRHNNPREVVVSLLQRIGLRGGQRFTFADIVDLLVDKKKGAGPSKWKAAQLFVTGEEAYVFRYSFLLLFFWGGSFFSWEDQARWSLPYPLRPMDNVLSSLRSTFRLMLTCVIWRCCRMQLQGQHRPPTTMRRTLR